MKFAYVLMIAIALAACQKQETATEKLAQGAPPAPTAPGPISERPASEGPPLPPLTAEGWGPITMEMTDQQARETLANVKADTVPHDEDWLACHTIELTKLEGVRIMVEEDRVTRVSISKPVTRIASDRGVKVGDEAAKVKAAYPEGGLVSSPHKYEAAPAAYLTWWSKKGVAGIRYTIGHDGRVESIAGGTPSIELVEGCA